MFFALTFLANFSVDFFGTRFSLAPEINNTSFSKLKSEAAVVVENFAEAATSFFDVYFDPAS